MIFGFIVLNRKLGVLPSNILFKRGKILTLSKTITDGIYEAEYLTTPTSEDFLHTEAPPSEVAETPEDPVELIAEFFKNFGNESAPPVYYHTRKITSIP